MSKGIIEAARRRLGVLFEGLGRGNIRHSRGLCLIGYVPDAIGYLHRSLAGDHRGWDPEGVSALQGEVSRVFSYHSMFWESTELVRQCIRRGYVVDYVFRVYPKPAKQLAKYDVMIDEWNNLPVWSHENTRARKLFYATGAEWSFHNHAELTRIRWLLERRGFSVPPQRAIPPLLNAEDADLITSFGNRFINETFGPRYVRKMRHLSLSCVDDHAELCPKDWDRARKTFLCFIGGGWVMRGLDLVFEAFLRKRNLNLVVAGGGLNSEGYHREGMFSKIYGAELERAPNIRFHGHVNVFGEKFRRLVASTCAVVVPSASDSCSGSVLQCMHHGLIPVVTPSTGIEVPEPLKMLEGRTDTELIEEISERCEELSQSPVTEFERWRRLCWEFARQNHTREAYTHSVSQVLDELLGPVNEN